MMSLQNRCHSSLPLRSALAIAVTLTLAQFVGVAPVRADVPHEVPPAAHETAEKTPEHAAAAHVHAEDFSWMSLIWDGHEQHAVKEKIGQVFGEKSEKTAKGLKYADNGHLTHVFMAAIAFVIVLGGAFAARRRLAASVDAGVLPERSFSPLLIFELMIGGVWNLMKNAMGAAEARRHFPIVCTLALYIFTMNFLALIPGGAPATDNLNTNIIMGLTVFAATHFAGIRVQGPIGYAKHFAGPILALAPLIFVIEIISHCVRPVSLSLRLLGNMYGDHKVMEIFLGFHIPLLPLPVMALGLLVVCVQTLVFVLLSTVYLSMAVEHHPAKEGAHGHH